MVSSRSSDVTICCDHEPFSCHGHIWQFFEGMRLKKCLRLGCTQVELRWHPGEAWVGPWRCLGANHSCICVAQARGCGDVAGSQEVARLWLVAIQATHKRQPCAAPQICINFYVNYTVRCKPGKKGNTNFANFTLVPAVWPRHEQLGLYVNKGCTLSFFSVPCM